MRVWKILALGLAVPALAQESAIEVQPLEPLIAPNASQNRDDGIVVRPVDPLAEPGAPERGQSDQQNTQGDLFSEGFNEDAFGSGRPSEDLPGDAAAEEGAFDENEGSWIDRAFGTPQPETDSRAARGPGIRSDGLFPDPAAEGGDGWFGLDSGPNPLSEAEDAPQFKTAPYTTRGRYGSDDPKALPRVATVPMEGAEIRQLDKMTGATRTVAIKSGQEERIGRLRVRLAACHAPTDGSEHGTRAFLKVWDPEREESEPTFSGWMFADSPALSALDHPRYDLWVLGCTPTRAAGAASTGEREEG